MIMPVTFVPHRQIDELDCCQDVLEEILIELRQLNQTIRRIYPEPTVPEPSSFDAIFGNKGE